MLTNGLPRQQRGFTLIEAMITMAIMAILLMLATPMVGDWILNARIRTAAEALQNGMQAARTEAVRCNVPVSFIRAAAGMDWTVEAAFPAMPTPCKDTMPAGQWPVFQRYRGEGVADVVLTPTPLGATTVTFDGMGRRMSAPDGLTRICIDLSPAVLPAARSRDLEVNIGIGGEIRMCDPKVTDVADTRLCRPDPVVDVCVGL